MGSSGKLISSVDILDGGVGTVDLAAGAVTQSGVSAGVSTVQTTSTTYVTILGSDGPSAELRVDLTTLGGDLLVWLSAVLAAGTGQVVYLAVSLDGAAEAGERYDLSNAAGDQHVVSVVYRFAAPSAGAHSVRGRWKVSAGTGTASTVFRTLMVMEAKR
jgi:hypothetical protein